MNLKFADTGHMSMGQEKSVKIPREAWYVAFMFFLFMMLHNADKFLISPLLGLIQAEFNLSYTQLGAIQTGSVIVAVIFMPVWGYVFDRFARPPLVALASAIWGVTTILSTFSRNFTELVITRALTGIDNESYSGVYSFLSDCFPPEKRATAVGFVNTSTAFGTLLGVIIGTIAGTTLGWRNAFIVTAVPGLILAAVILLTIKDKPRGVTEPELAEVKDKLKETFSLQSVRKLFERKSVILLFTQGFFGVFPWQILSYWLMLYMAQIRGFTADEQLIVMLVALLAMVGGNIVSGIGGDWAFKRSLKGRTMFAAVAVAVGLVLFDATVAVRGGLGLFLVLGGLTGFFIPMAGPNVSASIQDVALPGVRSSALSLQVFFENIGSASAPLLTGYLADMFGLEAAILIIVTITWALCAVLLWLTSYLIPKDIAWKRQELTERAKELSAK